MKRISTLTILMTFLLLSDFAFSQSRTVTGKITTEEGEALPGVSIILKGTTTGTVTDVEGNYKLEIPEGSPTTIIMSFMGYETVEVPLRGRSVINHSLKQDVAELNEVVVTALGISREKKALGYSVEQIGKATLEESGQTNVVSALQGRVAGVSISNSSGTPGAGADIIIRGMTSLDPNRSNRPLYVIDGIEMSDDVDALPILPSEGSNSTTSRTQASVANRAIDINPADIESISILKGAQATALYGIRAANGAVIITTKKGKKGKPQINLYYSGGWSEVNKTPSVQRKYIDGHYSTTAKRDGYLWDTWGTPVSDQDEDPTHDIYDDFFTTGSEQGFGGSVSGATDVFNYRFSVDRLYQQGVIPNTDWAKTNFSFTSGIDITPKLKANVSLRYANTGGNKPHEGDKSVLSALSYISTVADVNHYEDQYSYSDNAFGGIIDHPMFLVDHNKYVDDVNRYIAGIGLQYALNDHISFNYKVGTDIYSDVRTRIVHPETDEGSKVNGFVVEQNSHNSSMTSNAFAQFEYELPNELSLSGVIGQYTYINNKKYLSTRGEYLVLDGFYNLDNAINIYQDNSETKYRNAAIYGEVTLGFKNYLFLSVTGRNDWSSTLPKDNNSYFFPSASLTWIVSDMVDLPSLISFMKLRGSYAVVGKDASPYNLGTYFEKADNFPFGDAGGFVQYELIGDEDLNPEFTNTVELGFESRFLDNRLGVDITYYKSKLSDMILSVPVSNTTGFDKYVTNAGSMSSRGVEITLTGTPIKTNDFSWDVNLNWSTQEGTIDEIDEGIEEIELFSAWGITNKYVRGGKIGDMYGYKYKRAPNGKLIINSDGFPEVNWDSLQYAGNAMPDWTAAMTNTFRYKGLELSVLLEWKVGGDVLDMGRRNGIRNGQLAETSTRYEEVVFDGVNEVLDDGGNVIDYTTNTTAAEITPAFYRSTTYYNYAADVLLEDASWFRIRNISVAYNLPSSLFENLFVRSARVSFTAHNVFLSTPFKGYDPEINYFGSGSNIYGYSGLKTPATRSYTFRVNIGI